MNLTFVWNDIDKKWLMYENGLFKQYVEASMSEKITFAQKVQGIVTSLVQQNNTSKDLTEYFFDKGYNGGGADPITDADLAPLKISLADFTSAITLLQQIQNFFNNASVIQGDYYTSANKIRNDI